ncbi:MAG: hypothetical protein GKC10_07365 [Methanosarcinales archaeon]|nr:hypothetical protein [Methanosarcinales archaeon]
MGSEKGPVGDGNVIIVRSATFSLSEEVDVAGRKFLDEVLGSGPDNPPPVT